MIRSSIDIGTNTVLLLVADNTGQKLKIIHEDQRTPRLGRGVDKNRNLHAASVNRVLEALKEYQQILSSQFPEAEEPVVTATSAVRDANNRNAFIDQVFRETGIRVNILSGAKEAEYTYRGALSVLSNITRPVTVLDIGGGSTEIAAGKDLSLDDRFSFDIGSVRYTERYLSQDPPVAEQIERCRMTIRNEFNKRRFDMPDDAVMVGVAGTVTSLAFMELGLSAYESSILNGSELTTNQIDRWIKKLEGWSSSRLLHEYPVVMEGRADVFLAGILILEGFMDIYGFDKLMVSTGGIRHGALLDAIE